MYCPHPSINTRADNCLFSSPPSPYSVKDNLLVSAGREEGRELDGNESGTQNKKDENKDKNEDGDEDLDGKRFH